MVSSRERVNKIEWKLKKGRRRLQCNPRWGTYAVRRCVMERFDRTGWTGQALDIHNAPPRWSIVLLLLSATKVVMMTMMTMMMVMNDVGDDCDSDISDVEGGDPCCSDQWPQWTDKRQTTSTLLNLWIGHMFLLLDCGGQLNHLICFMRKGYSLHRLAVA